MHFIVQVNQLARPMNWVFGLKERYKHWSHALIVFAKDCLEYSKVKLTHFKNNFVKYLQVFCFLRVLFNFKHRCLQRFYDHIISIEHFLGKNHQQLVDLLVILKPEILKFKKFTRQKVFLVKLVFA